MGMTYWNVLWRWGVHLTYDTGGIGSPPGGWGGGNGLFYFYVCFFLLFMFILLHFNSVHFVLRQFDVCKTTSPSRSLTILCQQDKHQQAFGTHLPFPNKFPHSICWVGAILLSYLFSVYFGKWTLLVRCYSVWLRVPTANVSYVVSAGGKSLPDLRTSLLTEFLDLHLALWFLAMLHISH